MAPVTIPLIHRRLKFEKRDRTAEGWDELINLRGKYGVDPTRFRRRALNTVSTTNQDADVGYLVRIQVGTPPKDFNVYLDTELGDLWLSTSSCLRCTSPATGTPFNQTQSSTFSPVQGTLNTTYGYTHIFGTLGSDVVQLGQFQVSSQTFGLATSLGGSILIGGSSGILGLGFRGRASSGAIPWWQQASTEWSAPQMSFYLTRSRHGPYATNVEEPGGQFTLGGTNSSLYQGSINFINLVHDRYWAIPMTAIGIVNNKDIQVDSGNQVAVINTDMKFIGGPSSVLDQFYSLIPGARPGSQVSSSLRNDYIIPCNTSVQATLTFGDQAYTMQASDLIGGKTSDGKRCLGAFFKLDPQYLSSPGNASTTPTWVIGSAFLKNVYTVLQSEPAAVGFARLRDNVQEFGTLGVAGFSINENGHTNGTITGAASSQSGMTILGGALWNVIGLVVVLVSTLP
ncbi:SubName: Full=Related to cathepsin d (Lysosomal aspartyl protease) {ECO:0000313/EMBL:CCA71247.1} [Serendipita indica DSM 11827]|nr:SubName: Full=Related to cathepsin d (Lysosomal aspartyl protease) {ECO:0000313/EMBL:CCA71247.1} [Serendipita indica DSM 11827]